MQIGTFMSLPLNPFIAAAVFGATIVTDAVYVFFTAAVTARHRFRAANWYLPSEPASASIRPGQP
jgi:hypothetical protein